jgi:glycerophosphoryl diester phosphodiesterase
MAASIQVHGHRGARAVFPENTIPAFAYAIDQGADAVELDVVVTKDDVPVICHDPVLNPKICRGPDDRRVIRRLTFAELREWDCGSLVNTQFPKQNLVPGARVPALDEVLGLASRGSFLFNIEAKTGRPELDPTPAGFARLLLKSIDRHNLRPRVIVQSFDFRILLAMKQIAPDIRLAALYEDGRLGDFVRIAQSASAQIIAPRRDLVTAARVSAAHSADLQVIPWTANTPAEWDVLITAGIDGIITDDPATLIAYLKQKKLR